MKVTVIATGFPTDLPKRSLFQVQNKINDQTIANSTKEEVTDAVKKEVEKNNSEYIKKNGKDDKKVEDELFIDDTDDWSTVPAFLRRKK